eukprot:1030837-Amphidinium_carterae.1
MHLSVMVAGRADTMQRLMLPMNGNAIAASFCCMGCLSRVTCRLLPSHQELDMHKCAFVSYLWFSGGGPVEGMKLVTDAIVLHSSLHRIDPDVKKVLL